MLLLLLGSNTIWSLVNCALRLPFSIIKVTNLLFFYFVKCHRISKIILLVQFCMQIALKILIFQANSETKNIHQKIGRKSQFKKKSMLHVYYLHFNAIIMLVACGRKGRKKLCEKISCNHSNPLFFASLLSSPCFKNVISRKKSSSKRSPIQSSSLLLLLCLKLNDETHPELIGPRMISNDTT